LSFPLLPDQFDITKRENPSRLFHTRSLLAERQAFDGLDLGEQRALVHLQQSGQFRERQIGPPLERCQNDFRQHRPFIIVWIDDRHDPNTPSALNGARQHSQ
jgi:hypothetical protein